MPVTDHIEVQENDIRQRLIDKINDSNIDIEVLPDALDAWRRPFEKGRISVTYDMSKYGKVDEIGLIKQEDVMHFCLFIQCRTRQGEYGLYDLFNRSKKAVIGYAPTHCSKIYGISFEHVERAQDVWVYEFKIACNNILVENFDTDDGNFAPSFNSITFTNETDPENS